MLADALVAPPAIEIRVTLSQAVENVIALIDRMRRHFFDEGKNDPHWFKGRAQPCNSIDDREDPIGQGRRRASSASVNSLILSDQEIDRGDIKRMQQGYIDNIVRFGHRAKPLL
jgi:hypothetical protein